MDTNTQYSPESITAELGQDLMRERSFDLTRVFRISQVRESPLPQFDGMGYMKYNETNEMADISYLQPKKNKFDSRITTGITHEKDTTLVSMMEGFNFEGKVHVFYKNVEQTDLSTTITSWVRKSRELERYDEKRPINYRNLFAQGTAFTCEKYVERYVPKKIFDFSLVDFANLEKTKWKDAGLKKEYCGCESDLVDGKKVFLEDIRQWDIRKQPGVYTVEYVPREILEGIFRNNKYWKYIPKKSAPGVLSFITQGSIYSDWTFGEIDFDKIEVIQAYRQFENRYQIYLNGVPMLPAGFPLTAVSPSGLPPIAKGDIDLMQLFAYSKSVPAKTKIDQAVFDNMLRLMLIKFEQSAFPPKGNLSSTVVSPNIFMPGRITNNMRAEDLPDLMTNPGVTNSDFSMFQLVKEGIDSKSIGALLEGQNVPGDMTLGQYMDMQKKQMLKMGRYFDAVINWEKQMLHLRTMNLLANGTKPFEQTVQDGLIKNKYQDIATTDSFEDGQKGTRIIKFSENNILSPYEVMDEELKLREQTGQEIRYAYLDPNLARQMITDPDYCFYYEVVPVDKNNDKLTQMMFVAMVTQAINLFGIDSIQVSELKKRYASVMGEDFDKLFKSEEDMAQLQQEREMAQLAQMEGEKPVVDSGIKMPQPKAVETMFK